MTVERFTWTHLIRLAILGAAFTVYGANAQENLEKLPPGRSSEPLILDKRPPGTHFDAAGLILYGGKSSLFKIPPRYTLLSDPKRDPEASLGYPTTEVLESLEVPNAERYPLQLRDLDSPSISGFTVVGVQSRDLPWRVVKAMWDGDAIHIKGCSGDAVVSDVYIENVEDGLGPVEGLASWSLKNAYMKFIRDDAIENDDLIPGEISNCLIDGCFTFLSQQPGEEIDRTPVTTIEDCLVHIQAQPHDGTTDREWRDKNIESGSDGIGRAPGTIFKWTENTGSINVRNCIFRVDAVSVNGPRAMPFPPGKYANVTLVWLGKGDYPETLPAGVTITQKVSVWDDARAAWIRSLPKDHPAAASLKRPATQ